MDWAASENTRKRQSNSRIIYSTSLPSKIVKQNYALNIEKSLEKKLNAAKRAKNLSYEYPHGGVVADVATYQLLTSMFLLSFMAFLIILCIALRSSCINL
jgi:hypothetical protein